MSLLFPQTSSPPPEKGIAAPFSFAGDSGLLKNSFETPQEFKRAQISRGGTAGSPISPNLWGSSPADSNLGFGSSLNPSTPTQPLQPTPTPRSTRQKSLFYRDMATPTPAAPLSSSSTPSSDFSHFTHFASSPQQASAMAAAALWRDSVPGASDLPPPPCATLEDQIERLPEGTTPLRPVSSWSFSPEPSISPLPPLPTSPYFAPTSSFQKGSPLWPREPSPVRQLSLVGDAAVREPGVLLTVPPPLDVLGPPPVERVGIGGSPADQWVTAYGFGPDDTNLVLREFEKYGQILDHFNGPGNSNWIHIRYQSPYDAKRALSKNGIQLSQLLIIGVKPIDHVQLQSILSKHSANNGDQSTLHSGVVEFGSGLNGMQGSLASGCPSYLESKNAAHSSIAQPSRSSIRAFVDFVFGI